MSYFRHLISWIIAPIQQTFQIFVKIEAVSAGEKCGENYNISYFLKQNQKELIDLEHNII